MICILCFSDKSDEEFRLNRHTGKRKEFCIECAKARRSAMKHATYAKRENKDPNTCHRKWKRLSEKERNLSFYERNREKVKKWEKARRKRDLLRIQSHDRYRYNLAKDTSEYKERKRRWRTENPHKLIEQNIRRRTNKSNAKPKWLTAIQKAQIQEFYDLARARTLQTGIKYHVDHILPLKNPILCGLHVPWNLRLLAATKNSSKGNRLEEFKEILWTVL